MAIVLPIDLRDDADVVVQLHAAHSGTRVFHPHNLLVLNEHSGEGEILRVRFASAADRYPAAQIMYYGIPLKAICVLLSHRSEWALTCILFSSLMNSKIAPQITPTATSCSGPASQ